MDRVSHKAIEAVKALHAMMDGVELPEPAHAMAPIVDHGHDAVGKEDRDQELYNYRQRLRPKVPLGQSQADEQQETERDDVRDFIDDAVGRARTLVLVPPAIG